MDQEQPIKDTQSTRDLYSSPDVLPASATVDASLGLDSQLIAKARIAFNSYGVCLVKHLFNSADTKTALQTLKDIIVAPDPRVSSIYFEGSLRAHLRTASSFEGKTSLEMVGDDVTNNDQRKLILALNEVERLRYVRKVMGFSHSCTFLLLLRFCNIVESVSVGTI